MVVASMRSIFIVLLTAVLKKTKLNICILSNIYKIYARLHLVFTKENKYDTINIIENILTN